MLPCPGADSEGWPTKKILGFRWSEKAKIMLEETVIQQSMRKENLREVGICFI